MSAFLFQSEFIKITFCWNFLAGFTNQGVLSKDPTVLLDGATSFQHLYPTSLPGNVPTQPHGIPPQKYIWNSKKNGKIWWNYFFKNQRKTLTNSFLATVIMFNMKFDIFTSPTNSVCTNMLVSFHWKSWHRKYSALKLLMTRVKCWRQHFFLRQLKFFSRYWFEIRLWCFHLSVLYRLCYGRWLDKKLALVALNTTVFVTTTWVHVVKMVKFCKFSEKSFNSKSPKINHLDIF